MARERPDAAPKGYAKTLRQKDRARTILRRVGVPHAEGATRREGGESLRYFGGGAAGGYFPPLRLRFLFAGKENGDDHHPKKGAGGPACHAPGCPAGGPGGLRQLRRRLPDRRGKGAGGNEGLFGGPRHPGACRRPAGGVLPQNAGEAGPQSPAGPGAGRGGVPGLRRRGPDRGGQCGAAGVPRQRHPVSRSGGAGGDLPRILPDVRGLRPRRHRGHLPRDPLRQGPGERPLRRPEGRQMRGKPGK